MMINAFKDYLRQMCMVASIYLTVVLALERYLAISKPIQALIDTSRNGSDTSLSIHEILGSVFFIYILFSSWKGIGKFT